MDTRTEDCVARNGLQATFAPHNICFGCGHANEKGLRLSSFPRGDEVVAEWLAAAHHQAFPGILNGGIIGALLDCHSNWTAAWHLMQRNDQDRPPCTVTAEYAVKLRRPTPADGPVLLRAWVVDSTDERATIGAELTSDGTVCATCRGVFVSVKPGHPAYHRW
jgi:acyl-coenzyme A thioesterase PaaI-like protein